MYSKISSTKSVVCFNLQAWVARVSNSGGSWIIRTIVSSKQAIMFFSIIQICGIIIRDNEFRRLLSILEHNAHSLRNFALLTAASDLLLLRLTLRKKTIPTLLANVDVENLNLEGEKTCTDL